jgi:hypothetical protein
MTAETFDIGLEIESAFAVPFEGLYLPLIWSIGIYGFHDGEGNTSVPTVWKVKGNTTVSPVWKVEGDKYVCGYQTESGVCVVFLDWPVDTLELAKKFAVRVTGLAHEISMPSKE